MSRTDKMSRAPKNNRNSTEMNEEGNGGFFLPKIESKKNYSSNGDNYNFVNSKKSALSKDYGGASTKDLTESSIQDRLGVEELLQKIEELKKEIEQKTYSLMALQRNYDGLSFMIKKEKDLGAENKKKVAVLTEENLKLTEENRILQKRIADLMDRISQIEKGAESLEGYRKKINQLLEEQEQYKKKVTELQSLLEKNKKDFIELEGKNKVLSAQIDRLKKMVGEFEQEKQGFAGQLKQAKDEAIALQLENEKLEKGMLEYKIKMGELEKLNEELESYKRSSKGTEEQIREMRKVIETKDNQIESLKQMNTIVTSELSNARKENKEMEQKLKESNDQIRILSDKLSEAYSINKSLEQKNMEMGAVLDEVAKDLAQASKDTEQAKTLQKKAELELEDLNDKYKQVVQKLVELDQDKFRERLAKLEDRENQFNKVIAKIDHAQSSLLISLSCCECMQALKNPITLLPCSHNYCEKCVPSNSKCKECEGNPEIKNSFKNKLLGDIVAKVSYNQVILESLKSSA